MYIAGVSRRSIVERAKMQLELAPMVLSRSAALLLESRTLTAELEKTRQEIRRRAKPSTRFVQVVPHPSRPRLAIQLRDRLR